MTSERIAAAAIEIDGETITKPPPARHHDLIAVAVSLGHKQPIGGKQGFLTNTWRFVDRVEAAAIAFSAGQTKERKKRLFSEDLW